MKDRIITICIGVVAVCFVIAYWVALEASCAIIKGVGKCILF